MKFDIIGALKGAQEELGHKCTINCSLSDGAYLIQIKVVVSDSSAVSHKRVQVYGQQLAFSDHEVLMDEWYIMNDRFQSAIKSLKIQIEGDNSDNGSM